MDRSTHLHAQAAQGSVGAGGAAASGASTPGVTLGASAGGSSHHAATTALLSGLSKRNEIDTAVKAYLRSRGFSRAEAAMASETPGPGAGTFDSDAVRTITNFRQREQAIHYETAYTDLRDWVDGSLDLYKQELHGVIYPMLVHSFLEMCRKGELARAREFLDKYGKEFADTSARRDELLKLKSISSEYHVEENEVAKLFLNNRYEIVLSPYGKELVVNFLHDEVRRACLLKIINLRCSIRIRDDGEKGDEEGAGFVPAAERQGMLKNEILWGRLRKELYMVPDDFEKTIKEREKGKENGGDGSTPMTGVTTANGMTGGDKKGGKDEEEEEPRVLEDGTISASRIPLKKYRPKQLGLETEEDLRAQVPLGWMKDTLANGSNDEKKGHFALPSVLCYSFMNTKGEGLNCTAVSEDGAQVAGGFGDSSVRLWDSRVSGTGGGAARASRLIGHAGPVYSVHWTRCGRFVISGSEDGCVRLWSSMHKTDVVAYRGHNYPIWAVRFSPLDHYFASAGHDRTARIWVTDRVYPLRICAGHLADVDTVRWHPNCNYIATGSSDRTARLWDIRTGKCVRVFEARATVHALAFSPDGTRLAVAGDDPGVDVWDMRAAKKCDKFSTHSSTVWALEYSREGAVLASGSADKSVALRDAEAVGQQSKPHSLLRRKHRFMRSSLPDAICLLRVVTTLYEMSSVNCLQFLHADWLPTQSQISCRVRAQHKHLRQNRASLFRIRRLQV